jgi:hypothetical protein
VACRQFPLPGQKVCGSHGGRSPQAQAAAQARQQEAAARELARTLGAPRDVDPKTAILEQIHWSAGHVEFYRGQVQALEAAQVVRGTRGMQRAEKIGFQAGVTTTTDAGPDIHVWVRLYNEERKYLTTLCAEAVRLGLEEARVRVEMAQGARVAEAFRWLHSRIGARLGLPASSVDELRGDFTAALRALASGEPFPLPEING